MSNIKQLQEKWAPVLNHESVENISDSYKRGVIAQLLENQERASVEEAAMLTEAPTNACLSISNYTVKLRTAHYISYSLFDSVFLHGYLWQI